MVEGKGQTRDWLIIAPLPAGKKLVYANDMVETAIRANFESLLNCFKEKAPLKVAIELNIKQLKATTYYREYLNLKRLHKLYSAYEELGDEGIRDFLRLYRRAKKERIGVE